MDAASREDLGRGRQLASGQALQGRPQHRRSRQCQLHLNGRRRRAPAPPEQLQTLHRLSQQGASTIAVEVVGGVEVDVAREPGQRGTSGQVVVPTDPPPLRRPIAVLRTLRLARLKVLHLESAAEGRHRREHGVVERRLLHEKPISRSVGRSAAHRKRPRRHQGIDGRCGEGRRREGRQATPRRSLAALPVVAEEAWGRSRSCRQLVGNLPQALRELGDNGLAKPLLVDAEACDDAEGRTKRGQPAALQLRRQGHPEGDVCLEGVAQLVEGGQDVHDAGQCHFLDSLRKGPAGGAQERIVAEAQRGEGLGEHR
mmetsp:Transcript_47910/g.133413  ORF Transcript_47910/g.133413 Transcript_47910/m.133413 type:complete len:313 (-) Transcript_47910:72-1010(-)